MNRNWILKHLCASKANLNFFSDFDARLTVSTLPPNVFKLEKPWIHIHNRNVNCALFYSKQENENSPALVR